LPLGGEDGLPFSKGLMARALMGAGISPDRAYEVALAAEREIADSGRESISLERLEELAQRALGEVDGRSAMRRLRRFQDLYELDLPIILLIGGATGTGKSTVAARVHARDPPLELRGRPRDRRRRRRRQRGRARRVPGADA
jgi:2-phosphoglycerate kinase